MQKIVETVGMVGVAEVAGVVTRGNHAQALSAPMSSMDEAVDKSFQDTLRKRNEVNIKICRSKLTWAF